MSNTKILIFTLIAIAVIFIFVTSFLFITYFKSKNISSKNKYILKNIDPKRLERMDIIIREIKNISSKKPKWISIEKELIEIYNKIDNSILDIKSILKVYSSDGYNKNLYKQFKKDFLIIKKEIKKINFLEEKFNLKSNEITRQKDHLNKEYVFYRKILRDTQFVYKENMLQLTNIYEPISNFFNKIKSIDQNYHKHLEELNTNKAFEELKLYISHIKKIVLIVSEAEKIETHLFTTIKKYIQRLVENFKLKKRELNISFEHINFQKNINNISKIYLEAKKEYKNLNFTKTKIKIIQIYKSIKSIENLINFEVICRNQIISKKNLIEEETKNIFNQYKSIDFKIKKLVGEGKKINNELENAINLTKINFNKFKNSSKNFEDSFKNKKIPYSSKITRIKELLDNSNLLISSINQTFENIWILDIESTVLKNKFKKYETALNEINSNIKTFDIILSSKILDQKNNVEKLTFEISKLVYNNQFNNLLKEKLNLLVANISNLYSVVNGNIQLAEITKNLINFLAPKRSLNSELHANLNLIENHYLMGKYALSLNLIIEELNKIN